MDMVFRDVSKMDDFTDASIYKFFHINEEEKSTIKLFQGVKENEPAEGGGKQRRFTRKVRRV